MAGNLTFTHDYPVDPDRLFASVIDLDVLDAVSRPWVQFDHLPSGPVHTGQIIDIDISLFGMFPGLPYCMRVTLCDPSRRLMRSEEDGVGIRRVVHQVEVSPTTEGSRIVDKIEIEAGWKTFAAGLWAQFLFAMQHRARLRLLTQSRDT